MLLLVLVSDVFAYDFQLVFTRYLFFSLFSRGLTDRQENDKSFDRVTSNDRSNDRSKDRPQQSRRGVEEEGTDSLGGRGGGGSGGRGGDRNENGFGGRRKMEEEERSGGRAEKEFGGKPGGGAPWGKQFDEHRREGKIPGIKYGSLGENTIIIVIILFATVTSVFSPCR